MNLESLNAQPDAPPADTRAKASKQPGVLRSQVWLTVQTRQAHQLIYGREGSPARAPIIGLVGFAERLRIIWQAARDDDPWADWWLIKVCDALDATGDCIRNWKQDLDHLLAQPAGGMEVSLAESLRPCRVLLQFASPYAYQGARLLAEYDALVCRILTASHTGLLDSRHRDEVLDSCARRLRATFMIAQRYKLTGADREALRCGHSESRAACQAMGEVPQEVVSGERCAPMVPRKALAPAAVAPPGAPRRDEPPGQDGPQDRPDPDPQ